ncbi:hypothetical protein ACS0TY_001779 [Phlomoides rotata]
MSGLDFDPDCPLTNYMNSLKVVVLRVEVLLHEHKFLLGWMESLLSTFQFSIPGGSVVTCLCQVRNVADTG